MPIAHAISEDFVRDDKGDVPWIIESPDEFEYYVYFDSHDRHPERLHQVMDELQGTPGL